MLKSFTTLQLHRDFCSFGFFACIVFLTGFASRSAANDAEINVGSKLQLFVDHAVIHSLDGAQLKLHSPIPKEPVFNFDAPWEGPMSAYVTVLADGGEFRMYYRGGGDTSQEVTCLATSRDAIHWERPELGLYEFNGNKRNNIIYKGQRKAYWESHNFTPFIDRNPAATPQQRYKAVSLGRLLQPDGERAKTLVALASADGIHWQKMQEAPIITQGSFDSQNVAFWDSQSGQYLCYFRDARPTPDGRRVRNVLRTTSADFLNWTEPQWLDFGDSPLEQFYVNTILPYFREPNIYLGFPMRFVPERKVVGADNRTVDGVSDAVLISSRDGLRFQRTFMEAFLRPGLDQQNWGNAHGNNTPAWGLLQTSPTEISMYWAEHYGKIPRMRRGVVRVDGFVSVSAPYRGASIVTRPLKFQGQALHINYATSAVGSIRVEVQDHAGKTMPGFSADDCLEIYGDEVRRPVKWQNAAIETLEGNIVRLRFVMKDADLFSFQFESGRKAARDR
jgi:hypothetical protein